MLSCSGAWWQTSSVSFMANEVRALVSRPVSDQETQRQQQHPILASREDSLGRGTFGSHPVGWPSAMSHQEAFLLI